MCHQSYVTNDTAQEVGYPEGRDLRYGAMETGALGDDRFRPPLLDGGLGYVVHTACPSPRRSAFDVRERAFFVARGAAFLRRRMEESPATESGRWWAVTPRAPVRLLLQANLRCGPAVRSAVAERAERLFAKSSFQRPTTSDTMRRGGGHPARGEGFAAPISIDPVCLTDGSCPVLGELERSCFT